MIYGRVYDEEKRYNLHHTLRRKDDLKRKLFGKLLSDNKKSGRMYDESKRHYFHYSK